MAVETAAGEQWQWELRAKPRPFLLDVFVRLIREKPLGTVGLVIAVTFLFVATFADLLAPEWYNEINIVRRLSVPSSDNWMGTDQLGRDFYSRMVYGARISVFVGFGAVIIGLVLGYALGMISAWYGGWVDQLIMRVVDAWITIPTLVILLALSTVVPRGILPITLIIGLNFGIRNARLIRGYVLSLRENTYVEAARGIGASDRRIMLRHIAPNTFPPLFVTITGDVTSAITVEASLSFLGMGIPAPFPSWGGMLGGDSRFYMAEAWWMLVFPGVILTLVIFGWAVLSDALRDILDPRLRSR